MRVKPRLIAYQSRTRDQKRRLPGQWRGEAQGNAVNVPRGHHRPSSHECHRPTFVTARDNVPSMLRILKSHQSCEKREPMQD